MIFDKQIYQNARGKLCRSNAYAKSRHRLSIPMAKARGFPAFSVSQRLMIRFPFITSDRKKVVEHETGTAERAVD